ncbi:MAG: DUF1496 domain-containing protein [Pseudomonadota bacterium]
MTRSLSLACAILLAVPAASAADTHDTCLYGGDKYSEGAKIALSTGETIVCGPNIENDKDDEIKWRQAKTTWTRQLCYFEGEAFSPGLEVSLDDHDATCVNGKWAKD